MEWYKLEAENNVAQDLLTLEEVREYEANVKTRQTAYGDCLRRGICSVMVIVIGNRHGD